MQIVHLFLIERMSPANTDSSSFLCLAGWLLKGAGGGEGRGGKGTRGEKKVAVTCNDQSLLLLLLLLLALGEVVLFHPGHCPKSMRFPRSQQQQQQLLIACLPAASSHVAFQFR